MTRRLSGAKTPVKRGRGRGAAPKAAGSCAAAPQATPAATCPRTRIVWDRFTDLLPVSWTLGGANSHSHVDDSDAAREDDAGDDDAVCNIDERPLDAADQELQSARLTASQDGLGGEFSTLSSSTFQANLEAASAAMHGVGAAVNANVASEFREAAASAALANTIEKDNVVTVLGRDSVRASHSPHSLRPTHSHPLPLTRTLSHSHSLPLNQLTPAYPHSLPLTPTDSHSIPLNPTQPHSTPLTPAHPHSLVLTPPSTHSYLLPLPPTHSY